MIILRSDGNPAYNHAVVVDDHDMGITHVIRGVDHLTNAARQAQIYKAMGWDVPMFAHVPLIHGPDGAKLSKRHGALGVEAYRAMGYLPAGLRNYLARLGWSHGDDEIFSTAADDRLVRPRRHQQGAAAGFDFAKLADVNGHYIRQADHAELLARIREFLPEAPDGPALAARFEKVGWERLAAALPSLKERAKTLQELVDGAAYLIAERPLALDDKAAKLLDADARAILAQLVAPPRGRAGLGGASAGGRSAGICRGERPEARQGGPAPARRPDRPQRIPARVRRDGRAWPRRGAGAAFTDQVA